MTTQYDPGGAKASMLESELCDVEAALQEAEEQAAYWSTERARLYEKREVLLRRCVARPRVFPSRYGPVLP